VTPRHRERRAYVYIRQSTPKQVKHHLKSQRNQYALVQLALTLGWVPGRISVIDTDQAQSGQDGDRPGFQELVAAVSLGYVGLMLAYEASRLARNNAAWYTLLDLAALRGTLIADPDGIYDPRDYNDRLLLGLRGMLSEAELHVLRLRLDAGRLRQVERGEYRQQLPTGLVRREDGRVVKDPDQQVQHTLGVVFARFEQLGSGQKVLRSSRADGLQLSRVASVGARTAGKSCGASPVRPPSTRSCTTRRMPVPSSTGGRGHIQSGGRARHGACAARSRSGPSSTTGSMLPTWAGTSSWPTRRG